MDRIAIGLAGIAAVTAARFLSQPSMDTMVEKVDSHRAAKRAVEAAVGQYLPMNPPRIDEALSRAGMHGRRLVSMDPCRLDNDRVICRIDNGGEVQFPPSLTAELVPEIEKLRAEQDEAVAAEEAEGGSNASRR